MGITVLRGKYMNMGNKVNDLRARKQNASLGGGQTKIERQKEKGKQTARERILGLYDQGSFVEIDAFVETRSIDFDMQNRKVMGDGVVTGYGRINGRLVFSSTQDYTVMHGSMGEMHAKKISKMLDMAVKMGAPVVFINDSDGARLEEGVDVLAGFGDIFQKTATASGVIPMISVILGTCAGGAVYAPALTDFIIMCDKTSHMYMTGPSVIEAVTGEKTNADDLGGSHTQTEKTGNAHLRYAGENECLLGLKKLLSYLPDNNLSASPVVNGTDDVNRAVAEIYDMIPEDPKMPYDIRNIVTAVVDAGSFMEIQPDFAKNMITGLARIGGNSVGIVANNPQFLDGNLDVDASDKAARFVLFLDSFNIPILTFTDVQGYAIGVKQETMGIVRHGAKLIYAFTEASVPKINVIVGKAFGGAYIAMNSKHLGADVVYAFPTAQIAVMGTEGAADIIYAKDIAKSEDPINFRKDKIDEYRNRFASPYEAAKKGYVDDVIDPAFTRAYIAVALDMLKSKRETRPNKKHGNMPL